MNLFKKNILCIIVIFITLYSCKNKSSKDKPVSITENNDSWDKINNSTDHTDYLNFIIENSDTNSFKIALKQYFKYRDLLWDNTGLPRLPCNGYSNFLINDKGQVLMNDAYIQLDSIRTKSFNFLLNKNNDIELSRKKEFVDFNGTLRKVSTGFFELNFTQDSCPNLQFVINQIGLAISDYKNYLINKWYPKNSEQQDIAEKNLTYNFNERIFLFDFVSNTPMSPRPSQSNIIHIIPDSLPSNI